MNLTRAVLVALAASLVIAVPATAQVPDKFTNLQVLPKDTGKRELVGMMRDMSIALGVRCEHCHVEKRTASGEEESDFASDDKEPKRVARAMMKMTGEINGKLLPAAGRKNPVHVRCVTCHRGLTDPTTIDQVVLKTIDKDGVEAAIKGYRDLREKHLGDGAYDFSAGPLGQVVEELAERRGNVDGALAVARLGVELHPDAARAHVQLGQVLARKGDKAAAKASLNKALELEPGNEWVKRLLQRLDQPQ